MRLLPRTLLNRVFLLYGITLGVILVGGLALFLRKEVASDLEDANETATMVIEIAAQSVADGAVVNDLDAVRRTLQAAVSRTPFSLARFIEVGGQVIEERAGESPSRYAPEPLRDWIAERLPEVNRVISVGGRDYGVLRLDFQRDRITTNVWSTAVHACLIGLGGLAAGLVLTRRQLSRWLANLDDLGRYVAQIQAGRVDVRAAAARDAPEEVRRAIEQFNSAAGGLRDRFSQDIDALTHALAQQKMATDQTVIVIELDAEGKVGYVNDLFCEVSGHPREALQERQQRWSLEFDAYRDAALSRHAVWHGEVECRHARGVAMWMKRTVVPIRGADDAVQKYICLDIDISREKTAEQTLKEEKHRAEVTLHSIADGVMTTDAAGRIRYANPAAQRIVGLTARDLGGVPLEHVMRIQATQAGATPEGARRVRVRLPDARLAVLELSRAPLSDALDRPAGDVIAFRDVTAEHRIRRELSRLSIAVEHAASAILITNPDGRIVYANPTFQRMTGFAFEDIRGLTPSFMKSGETPPELYQSMWAAMRAGQTWRGELMNRRKDGTLFWSAVTISAVVDGQGRVQQYISVMEDASERRQAQETIHRLAYFDSLTALPNRRMFMERAVESLKAARLAGTPLAACYLDLDGFKNVNDTLGHHVGDALLAEVARRLQSCLRPTDFLGRLGGDEFALLIHDVPSIARVAEIGQGIIQALEAPLQIEGQRISIGTSIGVAMFPDDGQDLGDLLRKADMALYQAKEMGKRRLMFFSGEIEARKRQRAELEQALAVAQQSDQLRLLYQPKVDIATKAVVGAEALLRWHHPERGVIRPDDFIPLAEETRLIVPIGRWVIEQACRQLRDWYALGLSRMRVAVNIASVQFRDPNLAGDIERIVRETGIDASQLELEITESGLMEDPQAAALILERLCAIGLTIAIDDFGTGYSSLAYLKAFPVKVLKIDRSFVRDLESDANDRGIAEAVISMARVLKVDVVAEGVETLAQMDILERMGCQLAQGYYFSKPLSPDAFERFWWRHREHPRFEPTNAIADAAV